MKLQKLIISVIALLPLLTFSATSASTVPPEVLITELQVRGTAATGAADQEFVELYNATDQPVDMSTWKLQYKSATGSTWNDKVTLHGQLAPHSYYLLVSDKYPDPPTVNTGEPALALDVFSSGLSDSGGHVRIINAVIPTLPIVHDVLGWGSGANAAEGNAPATAPAGGKSLNRHINEDGSFKDTDNNNSDFGVNSEPSPQADPLLIVPEEPTPTPEPEPLPEPEPEQNSTPSDTQPAVETPEIAPTSTLLPPQITELLPNPAAPASDSTDEFIELYNPNDHPINLKDYKLQSGNTFSYSYNFDDNTLSAYEYRSFLVTQTSNILSNTSGQARLLDPAGMVVAQTNAYESAGEGESWALINGAWQWTTTPTPNAANILTQDTLKSVGVVKASSTKAKAKTTAATTKAAAKPKAATTAKPAKAAAERSVYEDPEAAPASIHPSILAGIGILTLVYAGYEYRHDLVNTGHRLRRYRSLRRTARADA